MRDLCQIAQDRQRVGAVGILGRQFLQRGGGLAAHDRLEEIQHAAPVGEAQHRAHLRRLDQSAAGPHRNRLIEQAHGVPGRAFGGPCDQGQRVGRNLGALLGRDSGEMVDHHLGFDAPQVEPLTARQDRHRHLADLGGGEDEFHMGRRLFQRLEQRVERAGREHVNLVDDIDLVPRAGGPIGDRVDDLAHVVDRGVRGRIHFQHVDMPPLGNRHTGLADAAGLGRGAARAVRADAVQALGHDPRRRRLSRPPYAGQDKGLRDPVRLEGVAQGADHRILALEVGEGLRAVLARQDLVFGAAHGDPFALR
ncbi:hypothetical protein jaqu_36610 [Jannaschia aquimarina]|uniref:Uncharacterized protein n=1 Tax=Jannaschia aquimarina TaxID=935700 RepID=A0A0D1EAB2_9RHOB|nr:hypothetical protein jaqu_36610 [Jannaschia aquimarina]